MAVNIKAALTRKIGPLPAWAWGGIAAGGIWLYRIYVRGQTVEKGGQSFDLGSDVGLTPVAGGGGPSPFGSAPFEQVSGTQGGSFSFGTSTGAYGSVEGPFDFIERLIVSPGFGGVIQPPPPVRAVDGTQTVSTPKAPITAKPAPVRQPAPQPISFLPLTPESIRLLFRNYPGQFIGNPEYWVNSLLGRGTPGVDAARTWEWADFWAAYARAGLPR